jgi:hypothetical protein
MFTVAGHQPDLLPYTGFFYKMAKADIFDLKVFDQYVNKGYQRRVMMRDKWCSLPLADSAGSYASIQEKVYAPSAQQTLAETIRQRYKGAPFYDKRIGQVTDLVYSCDSEQLWTYNLHLIIGIRDILGIDTPISIAKPTIGGRSEGLITVLKRYPLTHYLSGVGAKVYMEDSMDLFADAGIEVIFSSHKHKSGDSILTAIFDEEDPMSAVLAEHDGGN